MPRYCIYKDCLKQPTFNSSNEKIAIYCSEHKKENMIDIINKRCIHENCLKQPNYNLATEKNAIYCSEHKLENMINVISKRCIHENCLKLPLYNLATEKNAIYCSEHKLENMIDVIHKRCIHENCLKIPSYNFATKKNAIYCSEHKLENMIDIKHKRCIHENCSKLPSFNLPTEKIAIYCGEHKKENMINIKKNKCQSLKCKETPLYGLPEKRIQFCYKHKQPNMINLVLENKCSILDCDKEHDHLFNNIKYCNKHIPENSTIVVKRICKYCDINEDSKYVCKDCKKIQNKKEWSIVRYLRNAINTKFEYNSSKMLQGCSKKRPDIYFELNKHCVIVEIDEHQHNTYADSCECARINEIINGIGGKSVIIIRYNPDIVKNKGNTLKIKQIDRINLLVKTIKEELIKEYDTFIIKLIQLYYNDDYEIYKNVKKEDITNLVSI